MPFNLTTALQFSRVTFLPSSCVLPYLLLYPNIMFYLPPITPFGPQVLVVIMPMRISCSVLDSMALYCRFVWFSKGLHTDAFELEIKSLVLAGLLETSISEWGIAYAKEFADDLSTPGTPERRRRCRAYCRTSNPHRAIVRNLFTLACRNAEKQVLYLFLKCTDDNIITALTCNSNCCVVSLKHIPVAYF